MFRSVGYALRNHVAKARLMKLVDRFTVLTRFQRDRFVEWGIAPDRIEVVPNFIEERDPPSTSSVTSEEGVGECVGFAGRLSPEKGVETLLRAAAAAPGVPVRIAGHAARMGALRAPQNVEFLGELAPEHMGAFYRKCRFTVAPSIWFEGMPMVVVEAMLAGRPVLASRIGGLADLIEHGRTGFLVEPGDATGLAEGLRRLWEDPALCVRMGLAARERVIGEFGRDVYYARMLKVYTELTARTSV
jgi:glycosyltransferase involved in cell wall biosynthesis